jgi:phosphatidylserine decarboxylase
MGRFNLGSTVILLFPPGAVTWAPALVAGSAVRMGQRIGSLAPSAGASTH